MIATKLFGILLKEFQDANPKVVVPSNFSEIQDKVISALLVKANNTKKSVDQVNLIKAYLKILSNGDKKAYRKAKRRVASSSRIAPAIRELLYKKRSALKFNTVSPPGPARLCRVPFYPISPADAWSARWLDIDTTTPQKQGFGIEELGDDPVLALGPFLSTQDTTHAGPFAMQTRKCEFGAYRMIGLEINFHPGSRYIGAVRPTTAAVAATATVTNNGPAAVRSTMTFTVNDAITQANINIRIVCVNSLGAVINDSTLVSVPVGAGALQFNVGGGGAPTLPANTVATNLGAAITAIGAASFTAAVVGATVVVTMATFGTVGNGQVASSDVTGANGISTSGNFGSTTAGVDNVPVGTNITITDDGGTSLTFTAVAGGAAGSQFDIDQAVAATTVTNLRNTINASALDINGAVVGLTINLTADNGGIAGNDVANGGLTTFTTSDAAILTVVPFNGGTDGSISFNLTNPISPIGVTLRELTVYNGDNILIVEDSESVSAGMFNILTRPETFSYTYGFGTGIGVNIPGQPQSPLNKYKSEHAYKFIGFRDQPIVETNSQVFVKVEAFINAILTWNVGAGGAYPTNRPLPKIPPIPFSMNLVVDLLDDSIFGDPLIPSPASRSAANIKLGRLEVGPDEIVVTNSISRDTDR